MPPRLRLLLIFLLLILPGCRSNQPPGKFDPRDVRGYVSRLNRSDHPDAVRIRKELSEASSSLATQRTQATAEGIPLTPADLKRRPIPPSRNAAPLYRQLDALLKARPLNPPMNSAPSLDPTQRDTTPRTRIDEPMSPRRNYRAEEIQFARNRLAERRDVIKLIHRATDVPDCDFQRDWSKGITVLTPEFRTMRTAARLLGSESFLLARDGRFSEAVENQARGFRLAKHAASDPMLMSSLVGISLQSISLRGMEYLLEMAPDRTDVADMVQRAVKRSRSNFTLRQALYGEIALQQPLGYPSIRKSPEEIGALAFGTDFSRQMKRQSLEPEHRKFVIQLVDLGEARHIEFIRRIIRTEALPDSQRAVSLRAISAEIESTQKSLDPPAPLLSVFLPAYSSLGDRFVQITAQEDVTFVAAAVMAHRARTGRFPEALSKALNPIPKDPFTGNPLRYRKEANGFVVYSAGPTGRFDGSVTPLNPARREVYYRYPPAPPERAR